MKAMVFAAGLGTRLQPLTNTVPKALIRVDGVPLLEQVLIRLIDCGVSEVIINLHHLPQQIQSFLKLKNNFGIRIELSFEEKLLDTGGGLKQAAWFFDDDKPFLVHNVDIISDIDLVRMVRFHAASGGLATLAVKERQTSRYFIFDEENRLCGWRSIPQAREILARRPTEETVDLAFCGIHVISPRLLTKLTEQGAFSIVDSYLRLARQDEKITAFRADEFRWRDVGKFSEVT